MIIYFANRTMNILGQANTNLPGGLHIQNDIMQSDVETGVDTFSFDIEYSYGMRSEIETMMEVGNYILRKVNGEFKVYVIITTDNTSDGYNGTINAYCEDVGLDLLNEVSLPYIADQAYDISHYINMLLYDTGFEIGVNELSGVKYLIGWDDEATVMKRIQDVITVFGGEMRFSFEIDGLALKRKCINLYKKIGKDDGVILRMGKEINSITTHSTIEELTNALIVTGGIPENSEDPITLAGYAYDDGDIYVSGTMLKSRTSLSKWTRYLSETGADEGYLVKTFNYDTTNVTELFEAARSELRRLNDKIVTYEIDIAVLPDGVDVGDYVRISDPNGGIFLTSRILQLEISECNDSRRATLGEFIIQTDVIAKELSELATAFKKSNSRGIYTWVAYADDQNGHGISLSKYMADGVTLKKYMGMAYNRTSKMADITDASIYNWSLMKDLTLFRGCISADNGLILKAGGVETTTLTANVTYNQQAVTNEYTIKWRKNGIVVSEGVNYPVSIYDLLQPTVVFAFEAIDVTGEIVYTTSETITVANNLMIYNSVTKQWELVNDASLTNIVYAIGSVITNASDTYDPNSIYTGTTWENITQSGDVVYSWKRIS